MIKELIDLKKHLKKLQKTLGIRTKIYCIGFSKEHDAALLNKMAQSGS